jgi:hypothetical protein
MTVKTKEMILHIRRYVVAVLVLALGLTGLLLAALSGPAGSVPKENTTVITPSPSPTPATGTLLPGEVDKDLMGYG